MFAYIFCHTGIVLGIAVFWEGCQSANLSGLPPYLNAANEAVLGFKGRFSILAIQAMEGTIKRPVHDRFPSALVPDKTHSDQGGIGRTSCGPPLPARLGFGGSPWAPTALPKGLINMMRPTMMTRSSLQTVHAGAGPVGAPLLAGCTRRMALFSPSPFRAAVRPPARCTGTLRLQRRVPHGMFLDWSITLRPSWVGIGL